MIVLSRDNRSVRISLDTSLTSWPSRVLGIAPPERTTLTRRISLDAPHDAVEGCACLPPRGQIEQKLPFAHDAFTKALYPA
jgi:hypothetical protein